MLDEYGMFLALALGSQSALEMLLNLGRRAGRYFRCRASSRRSSARKLSDASQLLLFALILSISNQPAARLSASRSRTRAGTAIVLAGCAVALSAERPISGAA